MKAGDIVVCINAGVYGNTPNTITDGKHYEVCSVSLDALYVSIRNDRGRMGHFKAKRFKLLSDIREEKLKELGV